MPAAMGSALSGDPRLLRLKCKRAKAKGIFAAGERAGAARAWRSSISFHASNLPFSHRRRRMVATLLSLAAKLSYRDRIPESPSFPAPSGFASAGAGLLFSCSGVGRRRFRPQIADAHADTAGGYVDHRIAATNRLVRNVAKARDGLRWDDRLVRQLGKVADDLLDQCEEIGAGFG